MTFDVDELETAEYRATLRDQDGNPILRAQLSALTATLYNDDATGPANIINDREAHDLLTDPTATVGATDGRLTWRMAPEDHPIIDSRLRWERHSLLLDFTFGPDGRRGRHVVRFRVRNLRKVA